MLLNLNNNNNSKKKAYSKMMINYFNFGRNKKKRMSNFVKNKKY